MRGKDVADKNVLNGEVSLVGANTTIEGKVKTDGSIRIDGKLVGDVEAKANAVVGPSGVIEGTLTAKSVSVSGRVNGAITATEKLVLETKSVLRGDIKAAKLVVDEGATFDGQCAMSQEKRPAEAGHPTPLREAQQRQ